MKYDKKKEALPLDTVARARRVLADLGLLVVESWKQPCAEKEDVHSFSVRIEAPAYGFGTNGKGTTREYALASAYGEFMERLQNLIILQTDKLTPESLQQEGFNWFPDEKVMTVQEYLQTDDAFSRGVYEDYYREVPLMAESSLSQKAKVLEGYSDGEIHCLEDKILTWPFYSVSKKRVEYLWFRFVSALHGSNGMCAGNTPEEALVQGFSEIFERYASTRIMEDAITPPDVPAEEYAGYTAITKIIQQIESSGPFRVLIKDCSLGKQLPVYAAVLVDYEKQRYCASFGSHPHMPVAIERCLTELLQGYDPTDENDNRGKLQLLDASFQRNNSYLNICKMHIHGRGEFPPEFFAGEPSYRHIPLRGMDQADNKQMLRYCVDLARGLSDDVLVRDVSYLGFPAYFIIVPGISHYPMTRKIVLHETAYDSLLNIQQYKGNLDERKWKKLLIGLNRWDSSTVKHKLPFDCPELKTAVLLKLKEYQRACAYIELRMRQPASDEAEKLKLRALLYALRMLQRGDGMDCIGKTVSIFFPEGMWEYIESHWLCEDPVSLILDKIPQTVPLTQTEQASCKLFAELKKRFKENGIRQETLGGLFHEI